MPGVCSIGEDGSQRGSDGIALTAEGTGGVGAGSKGIARATKTGSSEGIGETMPAVICLFIADIECYLGGKGDAQV